MSIADKLLTIAENEQKVYEAGKLAVIKDSEYLSANEIGSIISANDVSPIEHKLGVKVGSKNFFDADTILPSLNNPSFPGWHWEKQADGSFYLGNVGTLHGCKWFENTTGYKGQFSISLLSKVPDLDEKYRSLHIIIQYTDGTTEAFYTYGSKSFVKQTLVSNANKTLSYIYQAYNGNAQTYIKDIMIAYGTDTTYAPYMTDFEGIEVTRCGKNIFDGSIQKGFGLSGTGNNRTVISDGSGYKIIRVKPNTTYYFSGDFSVEKDNTIRFASFTEYPTENSISNKFGYTNMSPAFTTTANDNYLFIWIISPQKTTDIAMQIEEGTTATEYEQYNGQTVTANADGTVEGLTSISPNMTLFTDTDGVSINCQYYRDIDRYIDNLIGNVVLSGGE